MNHNICSLLAEALFLVFIDGRKEASAMDRKWLWFNSPPWSWMALFKTHAPRVVCWPQLEPVVSHAFLYINSAVIYWAHIVNIVCSSVCSKDFDRKALQSFVFFCSGLPRRWKGKKNRVTSSSWPCFIFWTCETCLHACQPSMRKLSSTRLRCCACCTKGENSANEPTCCGCFTAKRAH